MSRADVRSIIGAIQRTRYEMHWGKSSRKDLAAEFVGNDAHLVQQWVLLPNQNAEPECYSKQHGAGYQDGRSNLRPSRGEHENQRWEHRGES